MATNATTEITKDSITSFNEAEIKELRDELYTSIKRVHGGMTKAAEACQCSTYQLRLVLKGVDTDFDVLLSAAKWLREYRSEQYLKIQSFVVTTKEALKIA